MRMVEGDEAGGVGEVAVADNENGGTLVGEAEVEDRVHKHLRRVVIRCTRRLAATFLSCYDCEYFAFYPSTEPREFQRPLVCLDLLYHLTERTQQQSAATPLASGDQGPGHPDPYNFKPVAIHHYLSRVILLF